MTRRTPEVKHAKLKVHGQGEVSARWELATRSTRVAPSKVISADGKRFLFSPDEEKKRREKEPKREEK